MVETILSRLRELTDRSGVSMKVVSDVSGIPYTTLVDMCKPGWENRTVTHLMALEKSLPILEAEAAAKEAAQ